MCDGAPKADSEPGTVGPRVRNECPEPDQVESIPGCRGAAVAVLLCMAFVLAGCDAPERPGAQPGRSGYNIDDDTISRNVIAALRAETEFPLHDVKVSTSGGDVVLSGELATHAQVDRSLAIVLLVNGVQRIENRLRASNPDAMTGGMGRSAPGMSPNAAARL